MGFAAISLLLGSMRLAGVFRFGNIALPGFDVWRDGVVWSLVFLFVGMFEEFFFRGYALFTLTTGMKFWPSAILLSGFFGWLHHGNPNESWVGASYRGGRHGLAFLPDAAANWRSLDAHRVSRGVGLGRNVFLRRA